jgi:peptidoglycan/xylan/chitin deacetylase (PgdA/CDA1 family)
LLVPRLAPWFRSGPPDRPLVALTVDDRFTPGERRRIGAAARRRKAKHVRFSCFPTGGALPTHLDAGKRHVWRRAVTEGREIGNHTETHLRSPPSPVATFAVRWAAPKNVLDAVLAKIIATATNGSIVVTHFTTFAEPSFAGAH